MKGGFPVETASGEYTSQLKGDSITIAQNMHKWLADDLSFYGLEKIDIFMLHRDDEDIKINEVIKRPKTSVKTIYDAVKVLDSLYTICAVSNWEDNRMSEFGDMLGSKLLCSSFFSLWERSERPWTGENSFKHEDLINDSYLQNCVLMSDRKSVV